METTQRIIDVREHPEFANGHIAGSELVPLGTLAAACKAWQHDEQLLLVCKSGRRAQQAHDQLTAFGFHQLSILPGGIEAWAAQGKPLVTLERRPWSMERQVRFAAGSLVLLTMLIAFTITRYALIATALVGAGLVFAGASDICMMASLLGRLPWNRSTASAAAPVRSQA
jgi:rhodanese-related sulfurtransferase